MKTLMTDYYDDEQCFGHCGVCEACEEAAYESADEYHDSYGLED